MTLFGTDVSVYQKGLDWNAVAAANVQFMAARASIGLQTDATFDYHVSHAEALGIVGGAYHYLYEGEGKRQAELFVRTVGDFTGRIAQLDVELRALTYPTIRDFLARFAALTNDHPIFVYTNISVWAGLGNPHIDGPLWLAYYPGGGYPGDSSPIWQRVVGGKRPTIWQYGPIHVDGKSIDGDAFRGTLDDFIAYAPGFTAASNIGDNVSLPILDDTAGVVPLPVGQHIYDLSGNLLTSVSVAQDAPSPFLTTVDGRQWRACYVKTGGVRQLVLGPNVGFVPNPPPPPPDCSAQVASAIAEDRAKAHIVYE